MSEFEIRVYLSRELTWWFIAGSDERPVSSANMYGVRSSKHSSTESNPDRDPNIENQGVQTCAGIRKDSEVVSRAISRRILLSSPRIGRPSDLMLPMRSSRLLKRSTESKSGMNTRLCTFLVAPCFL